MVISEKKGWIKGFECSSEKGFVFVAEVFDLASNGCCTETSYEFPYNVNTPNEIKIDEFKDRKVKITVELLEDD